MDEHDKETDCCVLVSCELWKENRSSFPFSTFVLALYASNNKNCTMQHAPRRGLCLSPFQSSGRLRSGPRYPGSSQCHQQLPSEFRDLQRQLCPWPYCAWSIDREIPETGQDWGTWEDPAKVQNYTLIPYGKKAATKKVRFRGLLKHMHHCSSKWSNAEWDEWTTERMIANEWTCVLLSRKYCTRPCSTRPKMFCYLTIDLTWLNWRSLCPSKY